MPPTPHTPLVRVTHWVNTLAFLTLTISGGAILIAHPRLYWGEAGAFGSAALLELPLPLNLDQSGWGRSLHFLAAWMCVLNGAVYITAGLASGHFQQHLLPRPGEFDWSFRRDAESYNTFQRVAYLGVVFGLFPLMIATGLAMSPAAGAALPALAGLFGGYQSSRTIHFFATAVLLAFLAVHLAMVYRGGFRAKMRRMIAGTAPAEPL
jgi:thiosulfate reductase cytochrome b subunit